MKEALERLASMLTVEEVQGLLEGTHQVTKVPPKRAKTADEIGEFLRFNKPSLIVHRGLVKALDESTFKVLSNDGDLIQPIAVNHTHFDAKNVPHLFLDRTGGPTWGTTVVARGGTIDAPGVESRVDLRNATVVARGGTIDAITKAEGKE